MRVKVIDISSCKEAKEVELVINAALEKLDGYFINDVKISPNVELAVITYTETRKR